MTVGHEGRYINIFTSCKLYRACCIYVARAASSTRISNFQSIYVDDQMRVIVYTLVWLFEVSLFPSYRTFFFVIINSRVSFVFFEG